MDTTPELIEREHFLEERALGMGAARYLAGVNKNEVGSIGGRALVKLMIPPLAADIRDWVEQAKSGRAGKGVGIALFVAQFPAEDVAFITARIVMQTFSQRAKLPSVAMVLARHLETASMSDALRREDIKAWRRVQTKAVKAAFPGKRYILLKDALGEPHVKRISWTQADKMRLGCTLIAKCMETSGTFTIETRFSSPSHSDTYIVVNDDTIDALTARHQNDSMLMPIHLPMVVPPKPWTTLYDGGYIGAVRGKRKLLSSKSLNKEYVEKLRDIDMPAVYATVNALQATPWRINQRVEQVIAASWDTGSLLGGLPAPSKLPIPAQPWGEGEAPTQEEAHEHRCAKARVHEANERNASQRITVEQQLSVAREFKAYDAIYFPHFMDWRGRLYPVPQPVNPQADDVGRALLEFAAAVPLGENGAFYLAVHGANCYGEDKVPLDVRVQWVDEHQDEIWDSATKPFDGTRFWVDAEKPFMFLAFCLEWAQLMEWVRYGKPQEEFLSRLPVSWDGSCNGLQNFSAMLRDPIGGAATNLVPSSVPADIYQRVADVASARVAADAAKGEVNAVYWLGKVTRKIAKRPTMTLPYGSGPYGFREQIREELDKIKADTGKPYLLGNEFLCSIYMANVLAAALGEVVVAARLAMNWLREVASLAAVAGNPVTWTAPSGFLVRQAYYKQIGQHVECTVGSRRYRMTLTVDSAAIDKKDMAQGISPNFVHSLDAAHLMRTVGLCLESGIEDFAMVHDSYGTHAGNAERLHVALRRAFVEQYSGNVLERLRDEILPQLPEAIRGKVPPLPATGTLDLTVVMKSEYFFA